MSNMDYERLSATEYNEDVPNPLQSDTLGTTVRARRLMAEEVELVVLLNEQNASWENLKRKF